jgi:hypothetical protein
MIKDYFDYKTSEVIKSEKPLFTQSFIININDYKKIKGLSFEKQKELHDKIVNIIKKF